MYAFDGPVEARDALQDYLSGNPKGIPADVRQRLYDATKERSPVVTCRVAAELIYARRADLPATAQDLAAGIAVVMAANGFNDFDRDARGARIAGALRRDAGTLPAGIDPQPADHDPAAAEEFVPKPAPEPATEPAG